MLDEYRYGTGTYNSFEKLLKSNKLCFKYDILNLYTGNYR
jgi:hypothetical protein